MVSQEQIEKVDELVLRAGTLAELPDSVVSGFDGEGWLWAWSERLNEDRDVEVHFRLLTNLHTHMFETELFGFARLVADPSVLCRTRRRSLDEIADVLESFVKDEGSSRSLAEFLSKFLATTHDEARDCAEALEELQQRNYDVRSKLDAIVEQNRERRALGSSLR
jgi:hypothetical protein